MVFAQYSYPLTAGQAILIIYGCVLVTTVIFSVFVMLLSEMLHSNIATLAINYFGYAYAFYDMYHSGTVSSCGANMGLVSKQLPYSMKYFRCASGFCFWTLFYSLAGCASNLYNNKHNNSCHWKTNIPTFSGFWQIAENSNGSHYLGV